MHFYISIRGKVFELSVVQKANNKRDRKHKCNTPINCTYLLNDWKIKWYEWTSVASSPWYRCPDFQVVKIFAVRTPTFRNFGSSKFSRRKKWNWRFEVGILTENEISTNINRTLESFEATLDATSIRVIYTSKKSKKI